MIFQEFIKANGITMVAEKTFENPNFPNAWPGASHYQFLFKNREGKTIVFYFTMGPALKHKPKAHEVLYCLAMDAQSVADYDFEDWCDEFSLDSDSRKAEKAYNACVSAAKKLEEWLGAELYEEFLDCVILS